MQAPDGDDSILIEAEVDRGTNIDESDENNNIETKVIAIGVATEDPTNSQDDGGMEIGQGSIYAISAGVLFLVLALFGLLAPAKVKKIE
jgi:hypothetical protein